MPNIESNKITIFIDGVCHICSMETKFLRKYGNPGAFSYVDISDPNFRAPDYGLEMQAVNESLHVRTGHGLMVHGLDAMIEIWQRVPKLNWLGKLATLPGFYQLFKLEYWLFQKIRQRLPKRKKSILCEL